MNAKKRNDITLFRQIEDETLFEAWEMLKDFLMKCLHHGIPIWIKMDTFYNGLVPSTRLMFGASSGWSLLSKSDEECVKLIENIKTNSYQWPTTRVNSIKKAVGLHEVGESTTPAA